MDFREGEGRGAPDRGHVTQYMTACLGRPPIKAPRGPPIVSAQSRDIQRQATRNGASGHHRRDSDHSGAATVGGRGARGGVDSISLQHCLPQFGVASIGQRQIFGEFGDWGANGPPP